MWNGAYILICLAAWNSFCWCEQEYVVMNEQIDPFGGVSETLVDLSDVKTVKRERFLNGSVIFKEDMDNDQYKFGVELYSSPARDGNYKKMAMDVPPIGVCEGFKKFYVQFVQPSFRFDENSNIPVVPEDGLCPFPAGSYYINHIAFNTDEWPNEIPRGLVKVVVTFYKNDSVIGGVTMVIRIEDK